MPKFFSFSHDDPCGPITPFEFAVFQDTVHSNCNTPDPKEYLYRLQDYNTEQVENLVSFRRLVKMGIRAPGELPDANA